MKTGFKNINLFAFLLFSSLVFYSVPTRCEAAVTPGRIVQQFVVFSMPQNCEASVMEQLCSSVTSFLDDEAAKADAALKGCKDKCAWKKRKDELVNAARKKAKESCARGEAPDINDINKGLDGNAKDKLKGLYDRNSQMFDGTAKLAAKDLTPALSNSAATLTGGGQVTDLKSSEPGINKTPTEFSLSGTKLSGMTPSLTTQKQSAILLASAALAKTSTDTASASTAKSQTDATTAKTTASAAAKVASEWDYENCAACLKDLPNGCFGICCKERPKDGWCETFCGYGNPLYPKDHPRYPDGNWGYCNCCKQYNSTCYNSNPCPDAAGPSPLKRIKNLWHGIFGEKPCDGGYYKAKTECCSGGAAFPKQACTTGSIEIAADSAELILYNPYMASKPISLRVTTNCCPGKIQWSSLSKKIEFVGATNRAVVKIAPVSESENKDDVSVTVTVDGITSAPKKLTVRRPKFMWKEGLVADQERYTVGSKLALRTKGVFYWIVEDQWGPLANVPVSEIVTVDWDASSKAGFVWGDQDFKNKNTDAAGRVEDRYLIWAEVSYTTVGQVTAVVNQKLIVAGWVGTSVVTITRNAEFGVVITGTDIKELK